MLSEQEVIHKLQKLMVFDKEKRCLFDLDIYFEIADFLLFMHELISFKSRFGPAENLKKIVLKSTYFLERMTRSH